MTFAELAFMGVKSMVPRRHGNPAFHQAAPLSMSSASLVVVERIVGPKTALDLQELTEALVLRWDPSLRIRLLVDLTDAELDRIGLEDLLEYVRYVEHLGLHQRAPVVALVAGRDINHSLARLYQTFVKHEDGALAVFTEVAAALRWIQSENCAKTG